MKRQHRLMRTIGLLGGGLAALLLTITGCTVGKNSCRKTTAQAIASAAMVQANPAPKKVKKLITYGGLRGQPLKPIYDGDPPREIEIIQGKMNEVAQAAAKIQYNPQATTLADVMDTSFGFRGHESNITELLDKYTQYAAGVEQQITAQAKDAPAGTVNKQRQDRAWQLTNQATNVLSELHKNANLLINPAQKEAFVAALVRHQQLVSEAQSLIDLIVKDDMLLVAVK